MMGVGLGVGLEPSVQVVGVLYKSLGPLHGEEMKRSGLFVCPCNKPDQPTPSAGGRRTGVVYPVATGVTPSDLPDAEGAACSNAFTDPPRTGSFLGVVPPLKLVRPVISSELQPTFADLCMTAPILRGVSKSKACLGREVRKGVQDITTMGSSDKDWSKLEFFEGLSSMMSVMSCST